METQTLMMISPQFLLVLAFLPCIPCLLFGQSYVVSRKASHALFHPLRMVSSQSNSGLLEGIPDITSAQYFSAKMSIPEAAALAQSYPLLYDIVSAQSDPDKCLEAIGHKMENFMEKNEVFNRKDFNNALEEVTNEKGTLSCVLGGKSTGKSVVLGALCDVENNNKKFIYVDLRKGYSSITEGVLACILNSNNPVWRETLMTLVISGIPSTLKLLKLENIEAILSSFVDDIKTEKRPIFLASLLNEMATESRSDIITLIIDEANLALTISDKATEEKIEQVKAVLALFTSLTKEEKKINVILVSSEHAFPNRLTDPRLGFNLGDISDFIFAGEIPPNEMFHLLTAQWEVPDTLARALLSFYGGHLYDINRALVRLRKLKADFFPFDANLSAGIAKSFKENENVDKTLLVDTLKLLAETGFAPLKDQDDPIAEVLSKHNVAGVVSRTALTIGLPRNVWNGDFEFGLVPTSQSMRVLIAKYLVINGKLTK